MQAADNDKADAVWCGGALRSTLAAARGTQEVALAACRRRCCWASVLLLASSRLGSGGASSAPHVALRGK